MTSTTRGLWNQNFGQIGATLRALEVHGVTEEHLHLIRSNPNYAKNIAKFICLTALELDSPNHEWARQVMNDNFFGIEEAMMYLGIEPTKDQISTLSRIPFTLKQLRKRKDTHFLVAVFPVSIIDIRDGFGSAILATDQDWYNSEPFIYEKGEVKWELIRKKMIFSGLTWERQKSMIPADERIPDLRTIVYSIVAYELLTEERMIETGEFIKSSDVLIDNHSHDHFLKGRVTATGKTKDELIIANDCGCDKLPGFGTISSVIPQ